MLGTRVAVVSPFVPGQRISACCKHVLAFAILLFCGASLSAVSSSMFAAAAQTAASSKSVVADWQGTLHPDGGRDIRLVLRVTEGDKNALRATLYSVDQAGAAVPATTVTFAEGTLKFFVERIDATYQGRMAPDGRSITGQLTQGKPLPLVFERATPETAWTIPEPPPPTKAMAADAKPSFEVATIKPSKPDQPGKGFLSRGDRFMTVNTTLADLIEFTYHVQEKQLLDAPAWVFTDKFDFSGQPDTPGTPSPDQLNGMMRKMLADRFQLNFHTGTRELPAYVLTVAKGGAKMKPSQGDPHSPPSLFLRGPGVLPAVNASMKELSEMMGAVVLDRPVVDQTGLPGKFDFLLKWTPDESQFAGMGVKLPPPSDAPDAPPPLTVALQEELGLKLDAGKAPVPVLMIDRAAKPSEN